MPGLNYDPNAIRPLYKNLRMSNYYAKEFYGEGTIGGEEGFYLKDMQDAEGNVLKRGDLVTFPELDPQPKFPTAIITDFFRYKTGDKSNTDKVEVQFVNGDKSEMASFYLHKRDLVAEETHREHAIQDIKSELQLHKTWSPGGSSGTIRGGALG